MTSGVPGTRDEPVGPGPAVRPDVDVRSTARRADVLFRRLTASSAGLVFVILAAIALFLLQQALPAIHADTANFLTTKSWLPDNQPVVFGVAALIYGTLVTSALALIIAAPVAISGAIWLTQYTKPSVSGPLGYFVDLLAAVPSVVYGLWGLIYLVPRMIPLSRWLSTYFSWIPIFRSDGIFGKSIFTASVVLAIMILPLIGAITREVFVTVPQEQREAALALGSTKWEMIRLAVLPYSRRGVIAACALGFGRALGETIAVALVLSSNYEISSHILTPGGNTIAANISNTFGEAGKTGRGALIASGLALFVISIAVNVAARSLVGRQARTRGARA